jgi:hypothetical protein
MEASLFALNDRLDGALRSSPATAAWLAEVRGQLQAYRMYLDAHVAASEARDGVYADLVETEPRVASHVDRLRVDCDLLRRLADASLAALDTPEPDAIGLRRRIRELIDVTRQYASRRVAIIHEAFAVDIGVG